MRANIVRIRNFEEFDFAMYFHTISNGFGASSASGACWFSAINAVYFSAAVDWFSQTMKKEVPTTSPSFEHLLRIAIFAITRSFSILLLSILTYLHCGNVADLFFCYLDGRKSKLRFMDESG